MYAVLRTPLYQYHASHGAKFVDFAGWEMPIYYTPPSGGPSGIIEEHKHVRSSGGLFDVSHMGRVWVSGRHARRFLERLCTRRITDMTPGQCRYSLVCNERGGVRDDVIVYKLDDDDYMVVVNASNREKLLGHFEQVKGDLIVKFDDRTLKTAMVALQGPRVMDLVSRFSKEIPTLKRYRFTQKNLLIAKILVSRTGYTGEDGVEAILPAGMVDMTIKLMLKDVDPAASDSPIRPAGLGARDTLRLEAGMPLYGHELGEEISALSSGLDFAISIDKDADERGEPYIGMEALKRTRDAGGPPVMLVGLNVDGKRTARQHMKVFDGAREVGVITSGCSSPTLGRSIAMAYVNKNLTTVGQRLSIDTGKGEKLEAQVAPIPFYKAPKP
jgi:aminomethyltransferase